MDDPQSTSRVTGPALVRAIGLRSAILLVITNVIGSAIFLTPGTMAATLPSETLLLVAWVAGGAIALCGGLTYAEMGAMYPRSGGLYVFLEEAFGPLVAFLYGWAGLLIILTGATAAVAMGFATYFAYFVPALSTTRIIIAVPLPWGAWSISAAQIVAAVSILALGAINYVGVESGNRLQAVLTIIKIAAIAVLPVLAIALHPATLSLSPIVAHVAHPAAAFGVVMIAVMWAYEGWYYLPFAAGEIADAPRTVPRALVLGILAIAAIYLSVNVAYMLALPIDEIRGVERIASKAMTALIGNGGARLVAATVVVSTLACNAAAVIAVSRACYAMAADGLFIRAAASVHPRYRTPHIAIALTCGWSALLTLTGTYEQLYTWVTFASVAFGVLGGLAIFKLRRSKPEVHRPYRTWGYPVVPALFVIALFALVVNTFIELPVESLVGLAIIALGLPAYWYWAGARA
ncbi:MAG: amino acid permease [Chthoniobacterales bacterium]|nr:amino acid permease [Chthoniobacterales bacterium]